MSVYLERTSLKLVPVLFGLAICWNAEAEVVRQLSIRSQPDGADVYLLRGIKEIYLGKTPLKYKATFHSKMSVLRFALKKSGHDTEKIEIGANQSDISVSLAGRDLVASEREIKKPVFKQMHRRFGSTIKEVLASALSGNKEYVLNIPMPARFKRLGDDVYLWIPLSIVKAPKKMHEIDDGTANEFLRDLWSQLDNDIAMPLGEVFRSEKKVNGIFFDVDYSHTQRKFQVGVKTEAYTEMECRGGTTSRYDSCASRATETRYVGGMNPRMETTTKCVGGYVSVYDSCATKVPVVRTKLAADPSVVLGSANARARYSVSRKLFSVKRSPEHRYPMVDVLLTDANGKSMVRHGDMPVASSVR